MIKSFLRTTIRSFLKNKAYTLINVLGLSIGISSAIIIYTVIEFELSYDQHHQDIDQLYRVVMESNVYGEKALRVGVAYPMPYAMKDDFPELEYISIADYNFGNPIFAVETIGGVTNYTEDPIYVDPEFFKMFTLDWIAGDPETVFSNPSSVVISKTVATKFFGSTDALGRVIKYKGEQDLQVTGVFDDPPLNSEFKFNMYLPFAIKNESNIDNWGSISDATQCYVKLRAGVDHDDMEYLLSDYISKHRALEEGVTMESYLQPVKDMHLEPEYGYSFNRTTSKETLWGMGVIGAFILLTAIINFINLNTVLVVRRSREVGVRKVLGGSRTQFITHFLGETALITLFSLLLSFGVIELVALQIDKLLGFDLQFNYWSSSATLSYILLIYFLTTLLSGMYPAWILAKVQPALAMKKKLYGSEKGKSTLRRSLVVIQFVISQILIVGTIVVSQQMDHFLSAPQGFESDAIIEVDFYSSDSKKQQAFRNSLLGESSILNVSLSNTGASNSNVWTTDATISDSSEVLRDQAQIKLADANFLDTYQLQLVAGQGLVPSDTAYRIVVNEALVKTFGFANNEDILGKEIKVWAGKAPVSGVVKDFISVSMHHAVQPLVITTRARNYHMAAIKIEPGNIQQALGKVESVWSDMFPDRIFSYVFLDERIEGYYETEQRTSRIFQIFSGLAIFIGCMGLFGLVSFMATQRTKEVGVRKVLGATVSSIVLLFSKEFMMLVGLAFVLAAPISYYFMNEWLQAFAYQIEITWWIMAAGIVLSIFIAVTTVGYKSYRAAVANPVDALRDE